MPRDISSRSSNLSAARALQRRAGTIPPWTTTIRSTPVLFFLSSAREIAAVLCPFFHRSHSSAFCAAVNRIRDVTMAHLLIPKISKVRKCCADQLNSPWPYRRCRVQQRPLLAVVLGFRLGTFGHDTFQLGTFGHDTFQLDIELVDNRLPLSTIASDGSCLLRSGGWRVEPDTAGKAIGCVLTIMSRNIHRMSPKTKCAGGISGRLARSNEREPNRLRAHRSSHDRTEKAK